jgi:hypothetical protein
MKILLGGFALGMAAMAAIFGVVSVITQDSSAPDIPQDVGIARRDGSVMDLICELQLDLDGQVALGIQANEPPRMAMAQIDLAKKSGWYQGRLAISDGRAGNLEVKGQQLIVSRPAMFPRFGTVITRESFVIDRSTGSFSQTLDTQDGRSVKLIRGTCARVFKPPF